MLRASGISKSFPGVQALDQIDFELRPGEIHALVGENGAGKSTFVKILGGAIQPDSGSLETNGSRLGSGGVTEARKRGISIIYQELSLIPSLTVAENIFLGMFPTKLGWIQQHEMKVEAEQILAQLGARIPADALVETLSIGQRQLVELARGLASGAKWLILDEPSAALTHAELKKLFQILRDLRLKGKGILYISHRLEEIFEISDRVTVFRDGKTVALSKTNETNRAQLIRWMVGREVEASAGPDWNPGETTVELQNFSCPPHRQPVSLQIRKGEILGLAGLVGAGRSELGLALFGANSPVSGRFLLNGSPIQIDWPGEALETGIGYLTEDRKDRGIFPELSISENMLLPHWRDFTEAGLLSFEKAEQRAEELRQDYDVRTSRLDNPISQLSGGNQQKALLARLLLHPLQLLILDEPTRGIDIAARAQAHEIIRKTAKSGIAILLISSELPELLELSHRIAVMREGQIRGVLDRKDFDSERILQLAVGEST